MKRMIVIALCLVPLAAASGAKFLMIADNEDFVFVCLSKTAHKYHKYEDCRGLLKCTHEVRKSSRSEVDTARLSACKICY
ncbi:hypothetical protein PBAL39_15724 [Pedobacter sp. BAL39]|nr:hypothetical protein PBAL39_15724 [Pedobacter sp. BAL39]